MKLARHCLGSSFLLYSAVSGCTPPAIPSRDKARVCLKMFPLFIREHKNAFTKRSPKNLGQRLHKLGKSKMVQIDVRYDANILKQVNHKI